MFFKNIGADFRRITSLVEKKTWIVRVIYPFTCPGFHAMIWYRLIQANRRYRIPILFYLFAMVLRVCNTFTQWFWGICIASNSEIGPGLYIAHHGQIFVGVKSMGANCTIGHNVTIGRTEKEHGYPRLGDNVYVAPGAVVIGKIIIGDNVKIGPNSVVRKDVPANSVVIAPPPKIIRMTSKAEWEAQKSVVEEEIKTPVPQPEVKTEIKVKPADVRENRPYQRDQRDQRDRYRQGGGNAGGRRPDRPDHRPQQSPKPQDHNNSPNKDVKGLHTPPRDNRDQNRNDRGPRNQQGNRPRPFRSDPGPGRNFNRDENRESTEKKDNGQKPSIAPPKVTPVPKEDLGPATNLTRTPSREPDSAPRTNETTGTGSGRMFGGNKQLNKWVEDMEGETLDD